MLALFQWKTCSYFQASSKSNERNNWIFDQLNYYRTNRIEIPCLFNVAARTLHSIWYFYSNFKLLLLTEIVSQKNDWTIFVFLFPTNFFPLIIFHLQMSEVLFRQIGKGIQIVLHLLISYYRDNEQQATVKANSCKMSISFSCMQHCSEIQLKCFSLLSRTKELI